MIYDAHRRIAQPGATSTCPSCGGEVRAKCGPLVSWHWAHIAADCDPWGEPESEWHLGWKRAMEERGAQIEVRMPPHRADVVMPTGQVIELQSSYLGANEIAKREEFYGWTLTWVYRCTWADRIQVGKRGFWWKHGSRAMTSHRRPVWWHIDDTLARVKLSAVERYGGGHRIVGRVVEERPAPDALRTVAA